MVGPIPTPELDKLANQGLRYTRFHTTAFCCPSRAAHITGSNHHNAGSGFLAEWATGFTSYHYMIPKSSGTIASTLKRNGYATSWFGKNGGLVLRRSRTCGMVKIATFAKPKTDGAHWLRRIFDLAPPILRIQLKLTKFATCFALPPI